MLFMLDEWMDVPPNWGIWAFSLVKGGIITQCKVRLMCHIPKKRITINKIPSVPKTAVCVESTR